MTERLPGTERILITNGEFVKEGYRRPDGVWKYGRKEDELFSNLSSKGVIAWMPLPKPYNPLNYRLVEEVKERAIERGSGYTEYESYDRVGKTEYADGRERYAEGFTDYHKR